MSEHFPEAIESNEYYTYVNGREIITSADTQYWFADVNQELLLAEPNELENIIEEANSDIRSVLPVGSDVAFSDCIANAYMVKPNGRVARSPQLSALNGMEYQGLDWHVFKKGIPEVVLQFQEAEQYTSDAPRRLFYVRPTPEDVGMFDLALFDMERQDAAIDLLRQSAAQMTVLLGSSEFASAPVEDKLDMIREALGSIEYCLAELAPMEADAVSILADRYYTIPTDFQVSEQDMELFAAKDFETPVELHGESTRVFIPELSEVAVADWRRFPISGGEPYLALEDTELGCSYWIPIDAVAALAFADTIPDDEDEE